MTPTFVLLLNDMRSQHVEDLQPVVRGTREQIVAFLERERVTQYSDDGTHTVVHDTDVRAQLAGGSVAEFRPMHTWDKSFRKGGLLEWFNPPYDLQHQIVKVGSAEDWATRARDNWNLKIGVIPVVPS